MSESGERWSTGGLSTNRIETLVDGVFAIAMTLMVLDLKLPDVADPGSQLELLYRLLELWPKVISYGLSFIILGVYWIGNHNMFHHIRRSDRPLLWLNLHFLMFVCFIPFSTSLLGLYPRTRVAVVTYGCNLLVIGILNLLIWRHATSGGRLVNADLDPSVVRLAYRRILISPTLALASIAVSFFSTILASALYLLIPALYALPSALDRRAGATRR